MKPDDAPMLPVMMTRVMAQCFNPQRQTNGCCREPKQEDNSCTRAWEVLFAILSLTASDMKKSREKSPPNAINGGAHDNKGGRSRESTHGKAGRDYSKMDARGSDGASRTSSVAAKKHSKKPKCSQFFQRIYYPCGSLLLNANSKIS